MAREGRTRTYVPRRSFLLQDVKPRKILWVTSSCRHNTLLGGGDPAPTSCDLGTVIKPSLLSDECL